MLPSTMLVKELVFGIKIKKYLDLKIGKSEKNSIIVTSIDLLPKTFKKPLFLVINDQISTERGNHWLAVFMDKEHALFFDSFGHSPTLEIEKFIEKHVDRSWDYNKVKMQPYNSDKCGAYSSVFLILCAQGYNLTQINSKFSKHNSFLNDMFLENMVHNEGCINKFK